MINLGKKRLINKVFLVTAILIGPFLVSAADCSLYDENMTSCNNQQPQCRWNYSTNVCDNLTTPADNSSSGFNAQQPSASPSNGNSGSGVFTISNPISSNTFAQLVQNIALLMVKIGTPIAAIFLIYSGFLFVSARGNDKKLENAKRTFWYTIIGTAIIVGAYAIATAVVNFAQQL